MKNKSKFHLFKCQNAIMFKLIVIFTKYPLFLHDKYMIKQNRSDQIKVVDSKSC